MTLINPTVWALLWGSVVGSVAKTALTHVVFRGPRMAFRWDREIVDDLWSFGKHIMSSSAVGFVANYSDRLILGALLDLRTFGFYVIAHTWVQLFVILIRKLSTQVGMALLSEAGREHPERLRPIFRKLTLSMDALSVLGFILCLVGGPILIDLLYRDEYLTAGTFISLLAVTVLTHRFEPFSQLLLSQGDSRTLLLTAIARTAAVLIALPLGFYAFGFAGALIGSAIAPIAGAPVLIWYTRPILKRSTVPDQLWIAGVFVIAALLYVFYGAL